MLMKFECIYHTNTLSDFRELTVDCLVFNSEDSLKAWRNETKMVEVFCIIDVVIFYMIFETHFKMILTNK